MCFRGAFSSVTGRGKTQQVLPLIEPESAGSVAQARIIIIISDAFNSPCFSFEDSL